MGGVPGQQEHPVKSRSLLSRLFIPQIALKDLKVMLAVSVIGAILSGTYGVLHDQVTYTISPEYFTKMKFEQFHYADFGLPDRVFVAEIGFLATWWIGLFSGWLFARRLIPGNSRLPARRKLLTAFTTVLICAILAGCLGFVYGILNDPKDILPSWREGMERLKIVDDRSFIQVAYIHNASYLGGIGGMILALICVRPHRPDLNPGPRAS